MSGRLPEAVGGLLSKVPRLTKPPSYHSFLNTVLKSPENKKALAIHGKEAIDAEHARILSKELGEAGLSKHINEFKSRDAMVAWRGYQLHHRLGSKTPVINAVAASTAAGLKLPPLGMHHKNDGKDFWRLQTYDNFARKAKKMNPSVSFTKELMDNAFRAAIKRLPQPRGGSSINGEKDIARCLRKESDQYWKD